MIRGFLLDLVRPLPVLAVFLAGLAVGWAMRPVPLNLTESVSVLRHLVFP
jgi:hypothetical protein